MEITPLIALRFVKIVDIQAGDEMLYFEYYPDVAEYWEKEKNTSLKDTTMFKFMQTHYNNFGKNEGRLSPTQLTEYHKVFRNPIRKPFGKLPADSGKITIDITEGGKFNLLARKSPYVWQIDCNKSPEKVNVAVTINPKASAATTSATSMTPKLISQTLGQEGILTFTIAGSKNTNIKSVEVNAIYGNTPDLLGPYVPPTNPDHVRPLFPGSSIAITMATVGEYIDRVYRRLVWRRLDPVIKEMDKLIDGVKANYSTKSLPRQVLEIEQAVANSDERKLLLDLPAYIKFALDNGKDPTKIAGKTYFKWPDNQAQGDILVDDSKQAVHGFDTTKLTSIPGDYTVILTHTIVDKQDKPYTTALIPPYPFTWYSPIRICKTDNEKISGTQQPLFITAKNVNVYGNLVTSMLSPTVILSPTARNITLDSQIMRIEFPENYSSYSFRISTGEKLEVLLGAASAGQVITSIVKPGATCEYVFKDGKIYIAMVGTATFRFFGLTTELSVGLNAPGSAFNPIPASALLSTDKYNNRGVTGT